MAPINFNIVIYTDSKSVITHINNKHNLKSQHKDTLTLLYEHLISIRKQHRVKTKLYHIEAHQQNIRSIQHLGNAIADFAAQSLTSTQQQATRSIDITRSYTHFHHRLNHNHLDLHQLHRLYVLKPHFNHHRLAHPTYKEDCTNHITTVQEIKQIIKDEIIHKTNDWISLYTNTTDIILNTQAINKINQQIKQHKHKHETKQYMQTIIDTINNNRIRNNRNNRINRH